MVNDLVTRPQTFDQLYPGVRFSKEGLELPDNLPFEAWVQVGETLSDIQKGINWARGYWLTYGESKYPDRYSQMLEATDLNGKQSLYNIAHVYKQFKDPESRYEGLSFSHHQELCNISSEYRPALAERAQTEGLSTYQLREEITHEKAVLGMVDPPYEVETADEFIEKWARTIFDDTWTEEGVLSCVEKLSNPTVEGSGRVLDIILARRKAALKGAK